MESIPVSHRPHEQPVAWWEWTALAMTMIAGAVLRFWNLAEVPPGLWYDEAINGLDALRILREPGWPIFFMTEGHPREPLYMYLEALGILTLGANAMAIRAVSGAIGVATIPAVWWMARTIAGPRVALLTLLFFVPMRWHVHFSRLAFRTILSPLFAALVVTFAVRTLRHGKIRDAIATGVLAGLSLYTYLSMRLFLIAVVLWAALALWKQWTGPAARARQLLAAASIAGILVLLPISINYVRHPEHFTGRQQEISLVSQGIEGWARILRQARDVALMPLVRGDHVAKHNIPGPPQFAQTYLWSIDPEDAMAHWADLAGDAPDPHGSGMPVFDLFAGLLLYFGAGLVVWKAIRRPGEAEALVVLWVVLGSAASIFSFGAPNMLRLLLLTPAAAFLLATGTEKLREVIATKSRALAVGALALLLAWFACGEAYRYFALWPRHPATWHEFNTNISDVARWMAARDDLPERIVLPAMIWNAPTFRFEADGLRGVEPDESQPVIDAPGVWLVASEPPFPRLRASLAEGIALREVRTFELPGGRVWARVLETEKKGPGP